MRWRAGRVVAALAAASALLAACAPPHERAYPAPSALARTAAPGGEGSGADGGGGPSPPDGVPDRPVLVDPRSFGRPQAGPVEGLLTFRGNPTRSWYGAGPLPSHPRVAWRFPERAMCSQSTDQDGPRSWCGTGWTGQPAVWQRDGRTWLAFGAFDRAVHVVDAVTGERILPDFPTGDIIKGSVTVDPDGFPLLYVGSRDAKLRVLSFDTGRLVELWSLDARAAGPTMWNDDWDGSPLVVGGWLVVGGENSRFHVVELNRRYADDGTVRAEPRLVFSAPGWDAELLRDLPDRNVSIEGSVALVGDLAYFANSGGLVQGWDLAPLRHGGEPQRTFRFWMGDDVDATVVADEEGHLYVAAEHERMLPRGREVGQVVKLDPRRPDPVVWRFSDLPPRGGRRSGAWATPAVVGGVVVVATDTGRLVGLDRAGGEVLWEKRLPGPLWQSPVVVDGVLVQGDCAGVLHGYDLGDGRSDPPHLWSVAVGGCVESTPAVWRGGIWVGTRAGFMAALR